MSSSRVRVIVEIALTVALCAVLKLWRIQLPWNFAGGDVSLVMLPILVLALRRGLVPGVIAGGIFGVIDFFYEPYAAAPVQVLLDYPVAFALLGVAGLGSVHYLSLARAGRRVAADGVAVAWMIVGAGARLAAHFASGIVFFGSNAPEGTPVWVYSALYNLSYVVPSLVVTLVVALIVLPVLDAAVPVTATRVGESGS